MVTNTSRQLNSSPVPTLVIHESLQRNERKQIKHCCCSQLLDWCGVDMWPHTHNSFLRCERVWFILILAVAVTLKKTLLQYAYSATVSSVDLKEKKNSAPSSPEAQSALQQCTHVPKPTYSIPFLQWDTHCKNVQPDYKQKNMQDTFKDEV